MSSILPNIDKPGLVPEWFPTPQQVFIFRNWGMVDKKRLAYVLETSVENIEKEAARMGLLPQDDTSIWDEKGYITIIRSNWHLLPYEQLLKLLGDWSEEKLAHILKEDDFLGFKLGSKPLCDKIQYVPLTKEQIEQTKKIKTIIEDLYKEKGTIKRKPFDFTYGKNQFVENSSIKSTQFSLNDNWCVLNETGSKIVDIMYDRFIKNTNKNFGVNLCGDKFKIVLSFIPAKKEEYHEIKITQTQIDIKAGGDNGILRALYRLEDMMKLSGGAYLSCGEFKREPRFDARFIYLYCGLYETAFDVDSKKYCDDELLEEYARIDVNGIWLQAVLYRLIEFKYAPEMSIGWENRQKNLRNLIERAKTYGIKVYLYINEPRAMPESFFDKYPHLKGSLRGKSYCMCTSVDETKQYLADSIIELCTSVQGIGGFFTISMSENATHCKSAWLPSQEPCPRCANREPWELVAEVNKVIADAVYSVDKSIKVFAWDWAWDKKLGFTDENVEKIIDMMPRNLGLQCK